MGMHLLELREKWEEGLKVVLEVPVYVSNCLPLQLDKFFVVLQDKNNLYHFHTYFPIQMQTEEVTFEISADLQRGTADKVFEAFHHRCPDGVHANILALV